MRGSRGVRGSSALQGVPQAWVVASAPAQLQMLADFKPVSVSTPQGNDDLQAREVSFVSGDNDAVICFSDCGDDHGPRGTPQNRPMRVTSKPANESAAGQSLLYLAEGGFGNDLSRLDPTSTCILARPGRRIRLRWEATGAPFQAPEWRGRSPPRDGHSGWKAINPRGAGTASPHQTKLLCFDCSA